MKEPPEVQVSKEFSVNVEARPPGSPGNQDPLEGSVSDSSAQPTGAGTQSGSLGIPSTQTASESLTETVNEDVLPAHVGDLPSRKDTLGFTPYVEAIASFLTNKVTKPPLTLSIEGEWGSGKSSFMMQLKEQLKNQMSVVNFNAWRYDKDEAMWAAFALEFARKLKSETPWRSRPWAHIKFFFRRFDWKRGWVEVGRLVLMVIAVLFILLLPLVIMWLSDSWPTSIGAVGAWFATTTARIIGAGGILGYLTLVALLAYKLKDVVGGTFKINLKQYLDTPDYEGRVAFIEEFHQDFKKVTEIYGQKKKVCVFIDDLDRCEVPKAADLMQALNLMISDDKESQLIFIMGMDREKVAAGLAVKHEKLLPYLAPAPTTNGTQSTRAFDPVQGLEYGYGFIEKFIQLPFRVPQADETQVHEFLKNLMEAGDADSLAVKTTDDKQAAVEGKQAEHAVTTDLTLLEEIVGMVAPTLDYNPRRLKQFINAFRLKTFIASKLNLFSEPADPEKYNKVTVQQIGKFVAISLRWPLLLADLDKERDLLSRLQTLVLGKTTPEALTKSENGKIVLKPTITVGDANKPVQITEALARWYGRDNLRTFLRVKLFDEKGRRVNGEIEEKYSLEKLDVNKLLQVSPVTKPASPTSPNTEDTGPQ